MWWHCVFVADQIITLQFINQQTLWSIFFFHLEPQVKRVVLLLCTLKAVDWNALNWLSSSTFWHWPGEPKAIPWTQLSPIRCSADGWAHNDIKVGDVYCWPTNLGWVMGPVLLFTCFLNGATLALYHGSPLGHGFGKFVQVVLSNFNAYFSLVNGHHLFSSCQIRVQKGMF